MSGYNYFSPTAEEAAPMMMNGGGAAANSRERVTRILVVGETRVGKTLLIRRLCDHIFGDTAIEHGMDDHSSFATPAQKAEDEEDLGPEWGPTVGLAIDALKRDTTVLARSSHQQDLGMAGGAWPTGGMGISTSSGYAGEGSYGGYGGYAAPSPSSGMQYRGTGAATSSGAAGGGSSAFSARGAAPPPLAPQRCSVTQTVEFHELGGTHGYRDIARLPLQNIQYDGVIFVYHRRNLTSTVYLTEWYHWVRSVLSVDATVSAPGNPHSGPSRRRTMPRFMLVGTQLEGDELKAAAAGVRKELDSTLHIGSVAIADEALLDGNVARKVRALESPHAPKQRSWGKSACQSVVHALLWPYHVLWCVTHPFFVLSEQYQEERGRRSRLVTMCTRAVERCMWLLYKLEQTVLYLMAVLLFGPYQEHVVLGHSPTKQTLEELRKDEQCVAQAHVCRLDSDLALQSSLDEIVAFFDILLRED